MSLDYHHLVRKQDDILIKKRKRDKAMKNKVKHNEEIDNLKKRIDELTNVNLSLQSTNDALQEELDNTKFDADTQKRISEKQQKYYQTSVVVKHNAINNSLRNVNIDIAHDDYKMIIRKSVHRKANYDMMHSLLKSAYLASIDRSKTQKESKSTNIDEYVKVRVFKILNDILKEEFAVRMFNKQLTSKQYFAII